MTEMMLVMMVEKMIVMREVMSDGGDGNWKQVSFIKYFIVYVYYLC